MKSFKNNKFSDPMHSGSSGASSIGASNSWRWTSGSAPFPAGQADMSTGLPNSTITNKMYTKTTADAANTLFMKKPLAAVNYDVIVVGGGIEGSACAYRLVKAGLKVMLLEQFPTSHTRGNSHGQSRVCQFTFPRSAMTRMMVDAVPMWKMIEQESLTKIFTNSGVLDMHRADSPALKKVTSTMQKFNVPLECLSPKELQTRYPVLDFGPNVAAVLDTSGGFMRASRARAAIQNVFNKMGGFFHDHEPAIDIIPGNIVTVKTTKGIYTAHNLVLTTGAWSPKWLSRLGMDIPLQPMKVAKMYCKTQCGKESMHTVGTLPCVIDSTDSDATGRGNSLYNIYSIPTSEYPGMVKLGLNYGPVVDPDDKDLTDNSCMIQEMCSTAANKFPYLEKTPSITESYVAACTPDGYPYIDRHPKFPNIVVATGFSGHGCKLAPAVGNAVCQLIQRTTPTYDLAPFRLDRFMTKALL